MGSEGSHHQSRVWSQILQAHAYQGRLPRHLDLGGGAWSCARSHYFRASQGRYDDRED